jgi:hypothetical protein
LHKLPNDCSALAWSGCTGFGENHVACGAAIYS